MPILLDDLAFSKVVIESKSVSDIIRKLDRVESGAARSYIKSRICRLGLSTDHFTKTANKADLTWRGRSVNLKDVLVKNRIGKRERITLLRRAFLSTGVDETCNMCGLSKIWNGRPLVLHIDHIDGCNTNNEVHNLRFLCPNCHSQTETFGHKNIKRRLNPHVGNPRPNPEDTTERFKNKYWTKTICSGCRVEFELQLSRFKKFGDNNFCSRICYLSEVRSAWPDKDSLKEMLSKNTITGVARHLGVSTTAVRAKCKKYGII
jgi:hypothetical protein